MRFVVTRGREADREGCVGELSIALTPYLVEKTQRVSYVNSMVDLVSVPRFGLRRTDGLPFRIAGRDGGDGPVIEFRFRPVKFLLPKLKRTIEPMVEIYQG